MYIHKDKETISLHLISRRVLQILHYLWNTASAASSPNNVAVSSIASSGQQNGERGREESVIAQSDVHVIRWFGRVPDMSRRYSIVLYFGRVFWGGRPKQNHWNAHNHLVLSCSFLKVAFFTEYTSENPKLPAKFNHHYNLSFIYENCPVCGKVFRCWSICLGISNLLCLINVKSSKQWSLLMCLETKCML